MLHPLLEHALQTAGASADQPPALEAWQALLEQLNGDLETASTSSERHRLMFHSNPVPIWVVDAQTMRFVEVNDAMVKTYGYSREELMAMSVAQLKLPEEATELQATYAVMPRDAVHHIGLRRHRCKDGSVIELDITAHAVKFQGRQHVLGIGLDTTQTRRFEEDLRQAQKMEAVGQLAGGIAHDFNNILAVILANAEFTLRSLGHDHSAATEIQEIQSAATRAATLTRQLLTFSRKQKRHPKPLALNSIVTSIEAMLVRIVGEDIVMSARIAPDLGTIRADPGEVEQVIMNLVVNARDAMSAGGHVDIETTNLVVDAGLGGQIGVPPGRYVVLSIADTGCGMTPAVRARIFEPFFTTKDVDKGTGLGLATVFGIVKQCQGAITVTSQVDRGTTFRIFWPRIDATVAAPVDETFVPAHGEGVVLVVEDDDQLRRALRRYLTSWGYTLLEASNAQVALELLATHQGPIDLLLTDLVMPGLDGRTLSHRVLAERPHVKVVFMSGYTEVSVSSDEVFVQKPFTAKSLNDALQRALS